MREVVFRLGGLEAHLWNSQIWECHLAEARSTFEKLLQPMAKWKMASCKHVLLKGRTLFYLSIIKPVLYCTT